MVMKRCRNTVILMVLFFCLPGVFSFHGELRGGDPVAHLPGDLLVWEQQVPSFPDFFKTVKEGNFLKNSDNDLWPALFAWTSSSHQEARYPAYHNSPFLSLMGIRVCEAVCHFSIRDGSLSKIYFSLYNRKTAQKNISGNEFLSMLTQLDRGISQMAGTAGEIQSEKIKNIPVTRKVWLDSQKYLAYVLLWSSSGNGKNFKPEFIQFDVMRFDPVQDPRKRPADQLLNAEKNKAETLIRNVKRNANGDIWIQNIPMVNQSGSGSSASAVAERVLRYFGINDINPNFLKQWGGAAIETSGSQMIAVFRRICSNYGVRVVPEYVRYRNISDLEKIVKKYNREAKKYNQKKVDLQIRNKAVDLDATLLSMHPDILYKVLNVDSLEQKTFIKKIQGSVEQGIPLVWCVTLGILPEENLSAGNRGGHMRLIIGINPKRKEIIYSDTWGIAHEIKVMPYNMAFMMTNSLYRLEPGKNRNDHN